MNRNWNRDVERELVFVLEKDGNRVCRINLENIDVDNDRIDVYFDVNFGSLGVNHFVDINDFEGKFLFNFGVYGIRFLSEKSLFSNNWKKVFEYEFCVSSNSDINKTIDDFNVALKEGIILIEDGFITNDEGVCHHNYLRVVIKRIKV